MDDPILRRQADDARQALDTAHQAMRHVEETDKLAEQLIIDLRVRTLELADLMEQYAHRLREVAERRKAPRTEETPT